MSVAMQTPRHYRATAAILGALVVLMALGTVYGVITRTPSSVVAWAGFSFAVAFGLAFGSWLLRGAVTGRIPKWLRKGIDEYW